MRSLDGICADDRSRCPASALAVGADVHDLAENMRVHGEERAEEHRRPTQLRGMIEPTAEDEYEQVSGLIQDVEGGTLLEAITREIVNGGECDKPRKPGQNIRSGEK